VKKLIARLKRGRAAAGAPASVEDDGFPSTPFEDGADETPQHIGWTERAASIGAQPFDRAEGRLLLAKAWAHDPHIRRLAEAEVAALAEHLQFFKVPAGQQVIGQNERGDYMLVVLEGRLSVDRLQPPGDASRPARLAEGRAGDMLGEMSLLDSGTRFSAVTTLADSHIAVLEAAQFEWLQQNEPKIALALLASLSRRLSLRVRQVSARLGALLSRS
jgi:hypothetical protein